MTTRTVRVPLWSTCLVLALTLTAGGIAGSILGNPQLLAGTAAAERATASAEASGPALADLSQAKLAPQTSFAPAVQRVMPSVVNIFSSRKVKTDIQNVQPFFNDPFFRRFFGDEFRGRPQVPPERQERSLGSGVIVSSDGYILTNNHVVDGATDIKVSLSDKREYTARVVGTDSKTDLAVLKIDQAGLPKVNFGDSKKVQIGDVVLAIGNPFGVGQTVTMGIVSAIGRGGLGIEDYEDFIQTDAAINPGNSGGALISAQGDLIGINTAILSRSGGNQGIGFAIPTNLASNVMDQIIQGGKVSRAYMGVIIQPVTPSIAKAFKLSRTEGALISDVSADSPAERAGLKPGDIITKVDGQVIADSRALQLMIGQMKPGKTVLISAVRDGVEKEHPVALTLQPEDRKASSSDGGNSATEQMLDGVSLQTLTPAIAREFGISQNINGVLVRRVTPDSPAGQAGLDSGDVILEVNRRPVSTVEQLRRYVDESRSDSTILFVSREGRTRYVVIPSK